MLGGPKMTLDFEATITLVNVGSVGQSRDGNPAASYAVYDDEAQIVELTPHALRRGGHPREILASGLPPGLADKLGRSSQRREGRQQYPGRRVTPANPPNKRETSRSQLTGISPPGMLWA